MALIKDLLAEVTQSGDVTRHCYAGLTKAQTEALARRDMPTYTGKVRDVVRRGDKIFMVHSDRLSAFDKLIGMVPYKGTILTAISEYWLSAAKKVARTHLVSRPHERVLLCERTEPFKVEVIVRGYLAGSMARAYASGEREFCGARLPEGLKPYGPLAAPIITPTTKAAAFEHDENISPAELIARGVVTASEWDEISAMALKLFAFGQETLNSVGWILVDTKYEFGRSAKGEIMVIDEIHTPDSSRFWIKDSYQARLAKGEAPEMLDKEVVRRYLIDQGFSGEGPVPHVPVERLVELAGVYLKVAETLAGRSLTSIGPQQVVSLEAL